MNSNDSNPAASAAHNVIPTTEETRPMMQIPASDWTTLMSSITGLREDVSTLHNKLSTFDTMQTKFSELQESHNRLQKLHSSTRNELICLNHGPPAAFPQFQRLPPEIRNMIWGHAILIPQLLVFDEGACSKSQINNIIHSCREARDAARSYPLDYYKVVRQSGDEENAFRLVSGKNYYNPDLDTIWEPGFHRDIVIPPVVIQMYCGICGRDVVLDSYDAGLVCKKACRKYQDKNRSQSPNLVKKYDAMDLPGGYNEPDYMGHTVWHLFHQKVKELLVVVGETPPLPNEGVIFVKPTVALPDAVDMNWPFEQNAKSWEEIASGMMENIKEYKARHGSRRARILKARADPRISHAQDISFHDLDYGELEDLSEWQLPTIQIVEAKAIGEKWKPAGVPEKSSGGFMTWQSDFVSWE